MRFDVDGETGVPVGGGGGVEVGDGGEARPALSWYPMSANPPSIFKVGARRGTHGIRNNNIQPPQLFNALLNNLHAIGLQPHIPMQRHGFDAILRRDGLCDLLCGRLARNVVDDYVCAFFGEFVADESA